MTKLFSHNKIKVLPALACVIISLLIFNINNLYSQNTTNYLKSFPICGGEFNNRLEHRTKWIIHNDGILRTVSWSENRIKTKVYLKDTKFADYDEKRDTTFTYYGQTIDPDNNLDLTERSFTYLKRVLFINLNEIHSDRGKLFEKVLFKIDNAEFIRIYNIKIYKTPSDKEYVFIYLQSGKTGIETGIYCYKLAPLLNNKSIDNRLRPDIFIPLQLRYYEDFSITHHSSKSGQLILSTTGKTGKSAYTIDNYFLNFNTKHYIKKQMFSHDYILTTPKIIQNERYKFIYFKKRIEKNRFYLHISLLNEAYDTITKNYESGWYLFNTPKNMRATFIERDGGFNAVWNGSDKVLLSGVVVASVGNQLRGAGTELILIQFDVVSGTFEKTTIIKDRPFYLYFNSDLHYDEVGNTIRLLWVAETDANKNGYPDRDAFMTYGKITDKAFHTVNLSQTPRPVWSPQQITGSNGTEHYLWLQEHPDNGYQVYHRTNKPDIRAEIANKLNLPLYGDNKETVFTFIFYYIISIGGGLFEGTIMNSIILLLLFILIIIAYRLLPRMGNGIHTLLLCFFALLLALSYGISPLSFPIYIPTIGIYVIGFIVSILFLILIDKIFYKKNIHTPVETCIKLWFFSLMFSVYINYSYMSSFIGNDMIVNLMLKG